MKNLRWLAAGVVVLAAVGSAPADERPLNAARSENKHFMLRIEPGRTGQAGRSCRAMLRGRSEGGTSQRRLWERALVNDVAPAQAFIRNDGRFLVTLDEYRRGGARHALVIYGAQGELLRHFVLTDLLDKSDWEHVQVGRHELIWLKDARCGFDEQADQFNIGLKWGRRIRVDLKTLQLVRVETATGLTVVPAEVLTLLLGHLEENGKQIIAQRLAELAQLTPEEQAQAQAVADALAPQPEAASQATADEAAVGEEPATEQLAATYDQQPAAEIVEQERVATADGISDDVPLPLVDAEPLVASTITDISVPMPDLEQPVDYVAWLNEMGRVDGDDAAPLYDAAAEGHAKWTGDRDLLFAALRGDPEALGSEEIAAWLADNDLALATFREATLREAKGWEHHSSDGSLIEVLLPNLPALRDLGRASLIDGHLLLAKGRPAEAAERYCDVLSAGAHTGGGMTIIENLMGMAMQLMTADALLDLQADPRADNLDLVDLAASTEVSYRPVRSAVETIQGERAFLLDSTQRLWEVDPQSGAHVLNEEQARKFLAMAETGEQDIDALVVALRDAGFEDTVAQGNAHWDATTEAFELPFQEGRRRLAELESGLADDASANPFLRALAPSLSRYHFAQTRAEATRRAALLVTNINAYHQTYDEYPPSLEAFGELGFMVDPFSGQRFVYSGAADGFTLYSVGGNGVDDAGVHDRKGATNDFVFWPRPIEP